ncbi:MAG: hypothetical protein CEN91_462, partial [Candidatus Berkelbacteria bacterium Licking1014_85]
NPGRRIFQLKAVLRRLEARQATVGSVIIGVNLLRLDVLQVQLSLIEHYIRRINYRVNAMLASSNLRLTSQNPNRFDGLEKALQEIRDELNHICIQPHLDVANTLRLLFRIAINICRQKKSVGLLRETLTKIVFLTQAILDGSLKQV